MKIYLNIYLGALLSIFLGFLFGNEFVTVDDNLGGDFSSVGGSLLKLLSNL